MADTPRLNGVIKALAKGDTTFVTFASPDIATAQAVGDADFDGIVFEMEHNPYDITNLKHCLQYMLNRRQIVRSGTIAPAVTPMVRIPVNGSEMNSFIAKQVLDIGVYGIVWPHVSTPDEARNCVAACRYPRPASAPNYEPAGIRGDSPRTAARYWGISNAEYYERADVWPLDPNGEILCAIMIEDVKGIKNLPSILGEVPGIGVVLIGEGDLSQDLGLPRQYDHPVVTDAKKEVLAACAKYKVPAGLPHGTAGNIEATIKEGFQWVMPGLERSLRALEIGRKAGIKN